MEKNKYVKSRVLTFPGSGRIPYMVPTTPAASHSDTVPILSLLLVSQVKQNKDNVDYHVAFSYSLV